MTKPEDTERRKMLEQITHVLSACGGVMVAYVFGSFVVGEKFEDIDVGLLLEETPAPYEGMNLAMHVAVDLEKGVRPRHEFEVHVLNLAPPQLQYEAIKGEVVFCRDEATRVRYEARLLCDYLDFRETSTWLDRQYLLRS